MALLEVEGLVKYFGRRLVVNGVSFHVNAGEVVGLLGPNGAGKTTSFRMATGQIVPNAGKVTFNDEDVTPLPMYKRARRGMGYLSQEPSVFRKLTVEKNLVAILEALPRSRSLGRRLTRKERWERADAALQQFKLEHVRKNTAGRCSGGEKRRLEIARCLVCEPLLILLDEPFAAVDPKTTEDIRQNIRDLARSGIGILITDHNVREVFRSADRVYLISEGQVVTHGTPHELVNDQKAIDAYLGRSFEEDGFTRHFAARAQPAPGSTPFFQPPEPLPEPRLPVVVTVPPPEPQPAVVPAPTPPPRPPVVIVPPPVARPRVVASPTAEPPPIAATTPPRPEPPAAPRPSPPPIPMATPLTPPVTPAVSVATPPPTRATQPATTPTPPPAPLHLAESSVFPSVTPAPTGGFTGVTGGLLGLELIRRAIEALADDAKVKAATVELVSKWGTAAIPVLLEALERRSPLLRRRAFEVLKFLSKDQGPLEFDPDGPDEARLRQIAYLRVKIERKT
jgi:lipopolysaccharide export system ATP-binding protein